MGLSNGGREQTSWCLFRWHRCHWSRSVLNGRIPAGAESYPPGLFRPRVIARDRSRFHPAGFQKPLGFLGFFDRHHLFRMGAFSRWRVAASGLGVRLSGRFAPGLGAEGRKRKTGASSLAPSEGAPVFHDPGHLRRSPGISSDFIRRRPSTTDRSSAVVNSIPTRKREASPGTTPPTRSDGTPFLFLRFHPIHIPPVSRDGRKWDDLRGRREHRHRRSRHRHGRFARGHHPSTRSRVRWTNIPVAGTSVRTRPRSRDQSRPTW